MRSTTYIAIVVEDVSKKSGDSICNQLYEVEPKIPIGGIESYVLEFIITSICSGFISFQKEV